MNPPIYRIAFYLVCSICTFLSSCKKEGNTNFQYAYTLQFDLQGNASSIVNNEYIYDVWLEVDNSDFLDEYQSRNMNLKEVIPSNAAIQITSPDSGTFNGFKRAGIGYGGLRFVVPPIDVAIKDAISPLPSALLNLETLPNDVVSYSRKQEVDFRFQFVHQNSSIPFPLKLTASITFDVSGEKR